MDDKRIKKFIVNTITSSRIIAAISMPILVNVLSAPMFLFVIALILFTDFLDGVLARHWEVSTIFGSLLDMGSDKVFAISILIVLSTMFPIMTIPLTIEMFISVFNIKNGINGKISKSSEIGRVKTWILGLSICSLLLVGLSPDIIKSLDVNKDFDIGKIINIFENNIGNNINNLVNSLKYNLKNVLEYIQEHKNIIESIGITSSIVSDAIVATDYTIKGIKETKHSDKNIKDIMMDKEKLKYIKKVLLDEKYFKVTKDMTMYERLIPSEEKKEEIKKLILEKM